MTPSPIRNSLLALLALGSLLVGIDAESTNIKQVTELLGVSLENGNNILLSDLAVPQRFHRKADRYEIYMELTEHRLNGTEIFLGSQRVLLADLTFVTSDGPNGRALYLVNWNTQDLQAGSSVGACAQVFKLDGRELSSLVCNELTPAN